MVDSERIQRYSRIVGIFLLAGFGLVFYVMHKQLLAIKMKKQNEEQASTAPGRHNIADPNALAAAREHLKTRMGDNYRILLVQDISGDKKAEVMAVSHAQAGRTDLISRLMVITPVSEGYDVLLDVEGFSISGRGLAVSTGVREEIRSAYPLMCPKVLTLQRIRYEPCQPGHQPSGYLIELRWDWEQQRFHQSVMKKQPNKTGG